MQESLTNEQTADVSDKKQSKKVDKLLFNAEEYAKHKLDLIIQREGDAGGARREPWYLAQLVEEAVRSSYISRFTIDYAYLCRYAEKQIGLKKEQLT